MARFSLRASLLAGLPHLLLLCLLPCSMLAQTEKPPTSSRPSSSTSTAKNVKNGTITAMDEESITLRAANAATTPYVLTEKTRYRKNRLDCELTDFKTGEAVVIKLRKVRNKDEYVVQEVNDKVSWDWISDLRKKTVQAVIKEIEETRLYVTVGKEAVPMEYTTSAKTRWAKGNKDASPEDFKPGEKVTIVPRGLPSGNVMATIVSDSEQGAALTKERYTRSVSGTIQMLDAAMKKITVLTPLKDTRLFAYTDQTEVRVLSKKVPLSTLRVGQKIAASLKKEEDTEETAYRINIDSKSISKTRRPVSGLGGSDQAEMLPKKVNPKKP